MKVLTIRQPWAWAIAKGFKDVENRVWSTEYRGLLAIHAGKSRKSLHELEKIKELTGVEAPDLIFGEIIAVVNLIDITKSSSSKWAVSGQYHWILEKPIEVEPIPVKGNQKLWELEGMYLPKKPKEGVIKLCKNY